MLLTKAKETGFPYDLSLFIARQRIADKAIRIVILPTRMNAIPTALRAAEVDISRLLSRSLLLVRIELVKGCQECVSGQLKPDQN